MFGNLYVGAFNGSGNGNAVFGGRGRSTASRSVTSTLASPMAAGNGNIVFGNGNCILKTTNQRQPSLREGYQRQVLNAGVGVANGSGNGNIVFNPYNNNALNVQILNNDFGVLNESGNGNQIFGSGSATNIAIENNTNGIANLSGNANVMGSCRTPTRT